MENLLCQRCRFLFERNKNRVFYCLRHGDSAAKGIVIVEDQSNPENFCPSIDYQPRMILEGRYVSLRNLSDDPWYRLYRDGFAQASRERLVDKDKVDEFLTRQFT